ncbi:MAG: hypothetical protein Q4F81_06005 [Eubacteriales bacterium]|nr:hypothetical protein [Eubacteriales bacterium]
MKPVVGELRAVCTIQLRGALTIQHKGIWLCDPILTIQRKNCRGFQEKQKKVPRACWTPYLKISVMAMVVTDIIDMQFPHLPIYHVFVIYDFTLQINPVFLRPMMVCAYKSARCR